MINKKLFIVIGIIFILVCTVAALAIKQKDNSALEQEGNETYLTIRGLDNINYLFDEQTQDAIVRSINHYLVRDNINTGTLEGQVRSGSFSKKEVYGNDVTTLLIDIPSVKRTYKVSSSASGEPDGDNSLYILCPSKEELIYGAFDCKDDVSE